MSSGIKVALMDAMPSGLRLFLRSLRRSPKVYWNGIHDVRRYVGNSAILGTEGNKERMRGVITATYHNIEKGLSLPAPRAGFGVANIEKLVTLLFSYLNQFGADDFVTIPVGVLEAYVAFNDRKNHDVGTLRGRLAELRHLILPAEPFSEGGVMRVESADIKRAVEGVGPEFFARRYSLRQFSERPVTEEEIEYAVRAAQKSPGVCNRQSGRIRVISQKARVAGALQIQGGARGFSEGVPILFCVTVDISNFNGIGERYQGWIDGGLFAMSFIFGLHAQGLGACCLNWSKDHKQDEVMRRYLKIPESETIIMFIAAGHLPATFEVARSARRPLSEVLLRDA